MTDPSDREPIVKTLAPGQAYPPPNRDALWRGVSGRRKHARRDRMTRVAGVAAIGLIVASGLMWRARARDSTTVRVAETASGMVESLRVIDASLSSLRDASVGADEVRVLEEKAFLLEMRGRLLAGSASVGRAIE